MATVEECEQALHELAGRLSGDGAKAADFDRTLRCVLPDLGITFTGHLHDGRLDDIRQAADGPAQITLRLSSDDLVALVAGRLNVASAWASGRMKVSAGMRDMFKLRSMF